MALHTKASSKCRDTRRKLKKDDIPPATLAVHLQRKPESLLMFDGTFVKKNFETFPHQNNLKKSFLACFHSFNVLSRLKILLVIGIFVNML